MRQIRVAVASAAVLVLAVAALVPARAYPRPGTLERVSVGVNGAQASFHGPQIGKCGNAVPRDVDGCIASISATGRYVVLSSPADSLVRNDNNHAPDVFLRDERTGRTELISVSKLGGSATATMGSFQPDVSADGRFVVFTSNALDLPTTGTKTHANFDVFLRDRKLGTTERVSVGQSGVEALGDSTEPVISADGRYVAFESDAPNLVPGSPVASGDQGPSVGNVKPTVDVFEWDRVTKHMVQVSVSSQGVPGDGNSEQASISADGRYVAFYSGNSTNLDGANRNAFVHDLRTGRTEGLGSGGGQIYRHAISSDGRYVVFSASQSGLVPNDSGPLGGSDTDVFVFDRRTRHIQRVSVQSSGAELNAGGRPGTYSETDYPKISPDGRFVTFTYYIYDLATPMPDYVMVHDIKAGTTEQVSVYSVLSPEAAVISQCDFGAQQPGFVEDPGMVLSGGGRFVSLTSCQPLVPGDTNKQVDVFVRDRGVVQGVDSVHGVRLARGGGSGPTAAGVVYRPASRDLWCRVDVASMPVFALASPAVVYGLNLTVRGVRYQVRAAKVGADAAFGVFRFDASLGWTLVRSLSGGYGTVAPGITVAVPLQAIGATGIRDVQDMVAFAGPGSFATGPLALPAHAYSGATG